MSPVLPMSEVVRVNEIGTSLDRTLEPDGGTRAKIARTLDLASLDAFTATLNIRPARVGWTLSGRVVAEAVQTCGLTLEPLQVSIDQTFSLDLVEAAEPVAGEEVEITLDDDSPDVIEEGRIDLGQYAVEQLALSLDPFPRKPGAAFVQPEEPADISPFAVLKAFRETDTPDKG